MTPAVLKNNLKKNVWIYALLIWKVVDFITTFVAQKTIPYLGFFSYGPTMKQFGLPEFITALTNFDGIFYIRIALYSYHLTEQAYFPLYPTLISLVHYFIPNPILAGWFISLSCFTIAFYLFQKLLPFLTPSKNITWIMLFLILYPTSYYFGVLYAESLFFLLIVSTLLSLKKKKYWLAALFSFLTALTKVTGVLLIIPIGISLLGLIIKDKPKKFISFMTKLLRQWPIILIMAASLLGIGSYSLYLHKTLDDPLYFVHAQESFGANRSSHLITPPQVIFRYLKIFTTADISFQYFVAIIELSFFIFALSIIAFELYQHWVRFRKKKNINYLRLGLCFFSLATIITPSLTGTLTAMPRYSLMALTVVIVLGEMKNKKVKILLLGIFALLHVSFFALFIQGYYLT